MFSFLNERRKDYNGRNKSDPVKYFFVNRKINNPHL